MNVGQKMIVLDKREKTVKVTEVDRVTKSGQFYLKLDSDKDRLGQRIRYKPSRAWDRIGVGFDEGSANVDTFKPTDSYNARHVSVYWCTDENLEKVQAQRDEMVKAAEERLEKCKREREEYEASRKKRRAETLAAYDDRFELSEVATIDVRDNDTRIYTLDIPVHPKAERKGGWERVIVQCKTELVPDWDESRKQDKDVYKHTIYATVARTNGGACGFITTSYRDCENDTVAVFEAVSDAYHDRW